MLSTWIVAQQAPPEGPGLITSLLPLFLIFFIFWFLVWKPQSKQRQQHQEFIKNLKVGDDVVTAGGIFGKVTAIDEDAVQLEVSRGTKVRVLRQQIQHAQPKALTDKPASEDKAEKPEKKKAKKDDKEDASW